LGKIQADRDSVHVDGLLRWLLAENSNPSLAHRCRQGAVHPALRGGRADEAVGRIEAKPDPPNAFVGLRLAANPTYIATPLRGSR
ncbi:MAG TPA: hypothetical protein VLR47_09585, partial [Rhodospirillales bacterium]|nr:hypothetical protein [Rhodospirillales bacterium]